MDPPNDEFGGNGIIIGGVLFLVFLVFFVLVPSGDVQSVL